MSSSCGLHQTTHTEKGETFPGPRRVRSELSGQGLQEPFEPEEPCPAQTAPGGAEPLTWGFIFLQEFQPKG